MYEIYCKLRDERKLKDSDVAKDTGITKSTFSDWKSGRSKPKNEKLKKIADFFGVSLEYLTGEEKNNNVKNLSSQEELDIINDVDVIIKRLKNGEEVVLRFNGEKTDDDGIELLRQSLLNTCRTAKLISKQKE